MVLLACTRSVRERLTFCDLGFLPFSADPRTASCTESDRGSGRSDSSVILVLPRGRRRGGRRPLLGLFLATLGLAALLALATTLGLAALGFGGLRRHLIV